MPDAPRITPRAKSRRAHQIGLLTGGLLLIFWGMLGYWALNARHATIENRTARLEQTVSIVEEQSAQMLSLIKLALLSADHWVAEHPSEDPGENRDFIRWTEEVRITSGQRVDVRMVTRDDKLSYIPRRADAGITDVSDREYVRIQKDPATRGFHIAAPVFSRVTKKWGIPISIPATNEHGRIAVLFGAIEQDSLTRLHTPHLDDAEESIYLLRDDGTILSRTPFIAELNGTSLAGTSAWTEYLSREAKGIYRTDQAPFAGVRRIAAFSHLKDFPLIVVASVPVSRILQPCRTARPRASCGQPRFRRLYPAVDQTGTRRRGRRTRAGIGRTTLH